MSNVNNLSSEKLEFERIVEEQIKSNQKDFDFDTREYPIEFLMTKFNPDDNEHSDIYIPDYQRDFIWSDKQQSLFIESLLIGLPIPYIFVADIDSSERIESDGRLEVVDGSQRLRTIYGYFKNNLKLEGLERLTLLENTRFNDLPISRQRRFLRTSIRMIELTQIDEEGRRTMFDRLNTGGTLLKEMEKRRGTQDSPFLDLIQELSNNELFLKLVPLSDAKRKHKDGQELVLRFLSYSNNYEEFKGQVRIFHNEFLESHKNISNADKDKLTSEFEIMLNFVHKNFTYGFRKSENARSVPRVRYEAIASGVILAIRHNQSLAYRTDINTEWVHTEDFNEKVTADGANSKPKLKERIEYVRDKILEQI